MEKILVVEDDSVFRAFIKASLENRFILSFAGDLEEAFRLAQSEVYDLYLVDIILPTGSGLDFCAFLRNQEKTKKKPILVLSSKNEVEDRVNGLDFGADDYLIKPCHPKELIARIKAQLRRQSEVATVTESMQISNYRIDFLKQRVFDSTGASLDLTHLEFKILVYFVRHVDHILSRNQILQAIWTENLNVTERVVDTHVSNLRKKLGPLGDSIKSVHGIGYSFSMSKAA